MKNKLRKLIQNKNMRKGVLAVALLMLVNISISGTAAYLFCQTDSMVNTFVSGTAPFGAVKITKNVEHDYGEGYVIPKNIKFDFQVDLTETCANMKFCDGIYKANEKGIVNITLMDKEEAVLNKIPAGTEVTVTEMNLPEGFTVDGDAERTKTVEKAKTSSFEYTNKYKAEKPDLSNLTVAGTKTIDGRDWLDTDSYEIVLEQNVNGKWEKVSSQDVKKESKTFSFTDAIKGIGFDNIGTYSFRVSETKGEAGGITYDTNISYFDIKITDDDMDGKMEVTDVTTSSSSNTKVTKNEESGAIDVEISFVNKYAPEGSVATFINITKKLEIISGGERTLEGYEFVLCDKDGKEAGTAATNATGEAVIRLVYEPDDADKEYTYSLKETNLKEPGIVYDDKEYSIKVSVVDNLDGTVSAYIYDAKHKDIPKDADNKYSAEFTNKYAPEPAKIDITGKKLLEGRTLKAGEFTFTLSEADENFTAKKIVSETKNTADGNIKPDKLSFKSAGEYYYLLTEKTDKKIKGITFDESAYRIQVKVTDDEKGSLHADMDISKLSKGSVYTVDEISFTNTYRETVDPSKPDDENPGSSENGNTNDKDSDGSKTGDPMDLALWLLKLSTSFEGLIILLVINRLAKSKNH